MREFDRKIIATTLSVFCLSSCAKTLSKHLPETAPAKSTVEPFVEVNSDAPGKELNKDSSIVYGKYTILDFSSQFCPACQQMKGYLHTLTSMRPDIVVRSFDVNRPGIQGIDWSSPLARQYKLRSLPYIEIANENGVLVAKGRSAQDQIIQRLNDEMREKSH